MAGAFRPGSLVAFWDSGALRLGVLAAEEKRRARLVVERGDELRVAGPRIAFTVEGVGAAPRATRDDQRAAGERVAAAVGRLRHRAGEVDVALVWEIALDATEGDSGRRLFTTADLAQLALGDGSGEACVALVWALAQDGVRFTRKGEDWEPRSAEAVAELVLQRDRIAQRRREEQEALDALREAARGGEFRPTGSETERRYLDALTQLAIHEESAADSVRSLALKALEASGLRWDRPHEAAFRLLRRIGRFGADDENLQIRRFGLRTEFPAPVLEQARAAAAAEPAWAEREDLTDLVVFSIDSARTREIDDALSVVDLGGGAVQLGIHIADPAAFIGVGDAVDEEAMARGLTHYFPETRLNMIPAEIAEHAASLAPGSRRPALSCLVEVNKQGEIAGERVCRSWIRSRSRFDYGEADRLIREAAGPASEPLSLLARMGAAREAARAEQGAISIHAPEVDVHVADDGTIALERIERESDARRGVTEAMILAGAIAARFCSQAGLAAIYRRQDPPATAVGLLAEGGWDPVSARAVRRSLRRAEVSLQPGRHHALGLDAYAQVTSPLRRFQDLAIQRQIAAHLAGVAAPYTHEAMQRIAATTEQAEAQARQAERSRADYWLLRYLERQAGKSVEACVVEVDPRPVIQLDETLWEQAMPGLEGAALGERLRVRIERVNPRAALLVLRRE